LANHTRAGTARPDFNLVEHLAREDADRQTVPARVWFAKAAQDRARRESYATLVEDRKRDGGAEFTLYTYSLEWMARWLLSFGPNAEALSPPKLRELVRLEAETIVRRHAD
jgi:predicted DNA-binding transcriptional regulator YafY